MTDTVRTLLTKPFNVGASIVTAEMIAGVLPILREAQAFKSHHVAARLYHAGMTYHYDSSEAANRLLQRLRKLGLIRFKHGHWWPISSEVEKVGSGTCRPSPQGHSGRR